MECPFCTKICHGYGNIRKHMRLYHSTQSIDLIKCKYPNCERQFELKNSFMKHLREKHFRSSPARIIDSEVDEVDVPICNDEEYVGSINFEDNGIDLDVNDKIDNILNYLYKNVHLTNKDIDDIIKNFKSFSPELAAIDSLTKRINYFKARNVYVKPIPIVLGTTDKGRPDSIQYISLIETMKKIFSNEDYFQACKKYMSKAPENPTILGDFKDASTFRASVETDQITFPFVVYYDDFESGNPLGSKKGIHKIGAVYMSLRCCDPFYYSKVDAIHLLMLLKSRQREKYDDSKIFERLIEEINALENEGLEFSNEKVKFKFIGFNGDNLGLHSLLGFSESFSADYSCRFCKITKKDLHRSCYLDKTKERNPDNYRVGKEGVMSNSPFNKIESFHCTTNYVVDAMHDLFNGVGNYVLSKALYFYIKNKYFSLQQLNESIAHFDIKKVNVKNRPSNIKEHNLLKGNLPLSCSEVKLVISYLPVLIGEFVPEDCQHWRLLLLLREIALITSSKKICTTSLDYLDSIISEHNQLYLKLFKDNLKPKFHYLLHYRDVILKSGPMSHLWSFRFESKHQSLKAYANVCKSRVDICMSIAKRIQLMRAASFLSDKSFNKSPSLSKKTSENNYKVLEYRGITYKIGYIIQVDYNENRPTFGEITNISSSLNNKIVIETLLYKTLHYNNHLDSFNVELSETPFQLMLGSALREPVMKYSLNNCEYVIYNKYEYN